MKNRVANTSESEFFYMIAYLIELVLDITISPLDDVSENLVLKESIACGYDGGL